MSTKRIKFTTFVAGFSYKTLEAYLAKHPEPVLLLEPASTNSYAPQLFDTLDEFRVGSQSATAVIKRPASERLNATPLGAVHPATELVWLIKSQRNPFVGMITIGRAGNNDVILDLGSISKFHALFRKERQEWFVQDSSSSNGTFLNGVRLPSGSQRVLADGSSIHLSDAMRAFFFLPESFFEFCRSMSRNSDQKKVNMTT